jgi:asparagine synthase (glutamine-hydrolysing)
MCGIVAMFSPSAPIGETPLERATKALQHRGPDGQRWWLSPDRHVGLGHARLSIIDLTTGDQPIANEDEKLRIVVNGELYGFEQIQKELERNGHKLRTRSDSEIVLHLYEELGALCVHRLRGEFAFVLWDDINKTLFAARDRFGIKPLFYARHNGALYFASEVKALFAAGVPARWDSESVYNAGGIGGSQSNTLFEGISQIPPGHFLLATGNHVQVSRYWDFDYPKETAGGSQRSDGEYEEEFTQALEEAVKLRLRADVPVACYLSGGVDSCAVLGLAAKYHQGPLRAFTLTFEQAEYSEESVAREMAAKSGAEFSPVLVRSNDLADAFADAIVQAEALAVNGHGVAKYLLSRAVRDAGFKVVLTGEGADEILGGYMHFRRDMPSDKGDAGSTNVSDGFPPHIARDSATANADPSADGDGIAVSGVRQLLGFVPYWMEIAFSISVGMRSLLTEDFVLANRREGFRSFFNDVDVPGQLTGRHRLNQSLYLWSKTRLLNYLLTLLGDRMEMAHSVEGRLPFLDHHLVELARSFPIAQKIRGATHKYILRQSMREIITPTVFRRPKQPFWSPPASVDPNGRLHTLLNDTLRGAPLRSLPFFDQKKVVHMLDELPRVDHFKRVTNEQILMMALSACVLQERFRVSA